MEVLAHLRLYQLLSLIQLLIKLFKQLVLLTGQALRVVIIINFKIFINHHLINFFLSIASLLSLQHYYRLNDAIGKTVTMLIHTDQLAFKYGNNVLESHNLQQLLVLVRILCQIGEFYLRHDKLNDAEMCCQEIATSHPLSYLHLYLRG